MAAGSNYTPLSLRWWPAMIVESTRPELTPHAGEAPQSGANRSHVPRHSGAPRRAGLLSLAAFAVATMGLASWLLLERPAVQPRPAPPVDFVALDGQRLALRSYQGQVLLVSFWRADCPACDRQMSMVSRLHHQLHNQGLRAIAVSAPDQSAVKARDFARRLALTFPSALDARGELARQLGPIDSLPAHILVDRNGMIVQRLDGDVSPALLEGRISEALASQ